MKEKISIDGNDFFAEAQIEQRINKQKPNQPN